MRAAFVTTEQDDSLDDAEVMRQACYDRAAFEPLYWRYHDRVYRYLRTRTPQDADAADLTQQVFLRALDQLHQYDDRRGTVAAWLFGIARHSAADFRRKHRRLLSAEEDLLAGLGTNAAESSEVEAIRRDEILCLHRALATLPPEKREIIALRFAAGLTLAEIGVVIGKSEEATRKQLRRTLQFLEEHYREINPSDLP
jgi:RNA polymerase sigma-70 factor (ECF subfamily)